MSGAQQGGGGVEGRVRGGEGHTQVVAEGAGVIPGVIVLQLVPTSTLQVVVGAVIGLGLAGVVTARHRRISPRLVTTAAVGLASGLRRVSGRLAPDGREFTRWACQCW